MSDIKPGTLALVVKGRLTGKIGTVIENLGPFKLGDPYVDSLGQKWRCQRPGKVVVVDIGAATAIRNQRGEDMTRRAVAFHRPHVRPLDADLSDDTIHTDEEITA